MAFCTTEARILTSCGARDGQRTQLGRLRSERRRSTHGARAPREPRKFRRDDRRSPLRKTDSLVSKVTTAPRIASALRAPGPPHARAACDQLLGASRVRVRGGRARRNAESRESRVGVRGGAPTYRFTGKEEDIEVGLQYFGKRYYAPSLGRWLSADPLAVHEPGSADLNLYAYVSGHVLQSVDPDGLDEFFTGVAEQAATKVGNLATAVATPPEHVQLALDAVVQGAKGDWQGARATAAAAVDAYVSRIKAAPEAIVSGVAAPFQRIGDDVVAAVTEPNERAAGRKAADAAGDAMEIVVTVATAGEAGAAVAGKLGRAAESAAVSAEANAARAGATARCPGGVCAGGAGTCFVAGTLVATDAGHQAIETIALGDRVDAGNAACAGDHVQADDKIFRFEMANPSEPTDIAILALLRPEPWLHELRWRDERTAWLALSEIGLSGWATLMSVDNAPMDRSGEGCLVVTTVNDPINPEKFGCLSKYLGNSTLVSARMHVFVHVLFMHTVHLVPYV
jgi:RHS repeat-associated protein